MRHKKWLFHSFAFSCCLLVMAGCGDEAAETGIDDNTPVELQVSPTVATLTRSAIGNTGSAGATTSSTLQSIAVYAQSTTTNTNAKNNNYALYSYSDGWSSGTDKIYLSSEDATVYAYHPAYQPGTNKEFKNPGTALKANTDDVTNTSTIAISVYEGGAGTADDYTITAEDNADKKYGSSWADNTAGKVKITSAPGEVDYMWATTQQADNGKGSGAQGSSKPLTMNHALSMLSFRVYNDGTYRNKGQLKKITLKNSSGATLTKGTNPTMNISNGTVTPGNAVAATYTRVIKEGSYDYYQIVTTGTSVSASVATTQEDAKAGSKKFSILVMPETAASSKNNVLAIFTIDGVDYEKALTSGPTTIQWEKGKNYLYSVKLSGAGLSITSVTVANWVDEVGGNLDIK